MHKWTESTSHVEYTLVPHIAGEGHVLTYRNTTSDEGPRPWSFLEGSVQRDILCTEILRLAQRARDLQGAIDTLESQLFATQQEREAEKTMRTQAEHRESLWRVSARKTGESLAAVERENRAKCLELAEAARRIRDLEAEVRSLRTEGGQTFEVLNSALAEKAGEIQRLESRCLLAAEKLSRLQADRDQTEQARLELLAHNRILEDVAANRLRRISELETERDAFREAKIRTGSRLLLAIEDAIGHTETARLTAINRVSPGPRQADILRELDLAHEVLTGATRGAEAAGRGAYDATPAEGERMRQQYAAPPLAEIAARVESLEESRGNHAVMLTDHAGRLKTAEAYLGFSTRPGQVVVTPADRFARIETRLSALEAGKKE